MLKFRGSDYLRGRHVFYITGDGLVVYPRLESLPVPAPPPTNQGCMEVGVEELDKNFDELLERVRKTIGPA